MVIIDGSKGEGGGQILRTSLSLAALTGRPFKLINIRANRSKPGLRPQHLTAVHAAAAICQAALVGAEINSPTLEFHPQAKPQGGSYTFDVQDAAEKGSAGAVTLIFQTLLWPLLFARQPSYISLHGGTHVPFSPPFHYMQNVSTRGYRSFGVKVVLGLVDWGWMPQGNGQMTAEIEPMAKLSAVKFRHQPVETVQGLAAVTNLPGHIPHRMSRRAYNLLEEAGFASAVQAFRGTSHAPGAGIFLWLQTGQAGFSALGRKGLPAQNVAEQAVGDMIDFARSEAAVDYHLADQLLIPMALAHGTSVYTTNELTQHTLTNADILRQWLDVDICIEGELDEVAEVTVRGIGLTAA